MEDILNKFVDPDVQESRIGLCGQYTDPYACEREEFRFHTQRLLHLDFAPESLSGTIMRLKSAKDGSVEEHLLTLIWGSGG